MEAFNISLQGIELYGYHGLYPGEKELGSKYKLELEFVVPAVPKDVVSLEDTVDYKKAYDIVVGIFKTPTPLLENISKHIAHQLKKEFAHATCIKVSVAKLNPSIGGICEAAKVAYELK